MDKTIDESEKDEPFTTVHIGVGRGVTGFELLHPGADEDAPGDSTLSWLGQCENGERREATLRDGDQSTTYVVDRSETTGLLARARALLGAPKGEG